MKKTKRKITAAALGILVTLVVGEALLRGMGAWHLRERQEAVVEKVQGPHSFRILCIGNSHTEGTGAPHGEGYPEQLGRLLSREFPGKNIEVFNRGVSNATSTNLLQSLGEWAREINPDIVTIRVGEPNEWNYSGLVRYKNKKEKNALLFLSALDQLKIFNLAQRLFYDLNYVKRDEQRKNYRVISWIERAQYSALNTESKRMSTEYKIEVIEGLKQYLEKYPKEHYPAYLISRLLLLDGRPAQAIYWAEQASVKFGRFHFFAYENALNARKELEKKGAALSEAGRFQGFFAEYAEDYKKSKHVWETFFKEGTKQDVLVRNMKSFEVQYQEFVEMVPGASYMALMFIEHVLLPAGKYGGALDILLNWHRYSMGLQRGTRNYGKIIQGATNDNPEMLNKITGQVDQFNAEFKEKFGFQSLFYANDWDENEEWALSDIREIIEMLESMNIQYVLMNYPPAPHRKRQIDDAIRRLAQQKKYNFLDTTNNLEAAYSNLSDKEKFSHYAAPFDGDEHLNSKGYGLLAQELAMYLRPLVEKKKTAGD